jgi:NAD(P)-dependent dehydrogenase (short-subunit alcohol dehydrogenase family)
VSEQQQRVAVISGASAGVGKAGAMALAALGFRVIGIGRDPTRSAAAEADIRAAAATGAAVHFIRADLALMAEVVRAAAEIAAATPRLDVLINNAGGVRDALVMTAEGNEATFAANHLAPFLLTRELMPLLRATAAQSPKGSVRVIGVSSTGHEYCRGFDWDDPQMLGRFNATGAYCQAKLANILFTRELARRGAADGIVAQVMHPGVVASNFASHGDADLQTYMKTLEAVSPAEAARTMVWLATAPEAGEGSGRYFHNCEALSPAPAALDDTAAARLWRESEALLARMGLGRRVTNQH